MNERKTTGEQVTDNRQLREVSCELSFDVVKPAELVFQIAAASTAGLITRERLECAVDSVAVTNTELRGPHGARLFSINASPGHLSVSYHAGIAAAAVVATGNRSRLSDEFGPAFERILYLRPSRYCPTDHLVGFARAEFGSADNSRDFVRAITEWISDRIDYLPGSGTVHDSAEDTLLTGTGSCRDFAHLGTALCRASGIPARFTSVYAPGLSPMDFHAVFETLHDDRWLVHDATHLAPRSSMVRIVTGRDAADVAFATVEQGAAAMGDLTVMATVGTGFSPEDIAAEVELA